MTIEQNKTITRQHMEQLDKRNLAGASELCRQGARWYGFGPEPLDLEGWKAAIKTFFEGFPDSRFPLDDVIAEGDLVAVRHSFRGTHQGEFQGIPPTGVKVTVPAIVIYRIVDGKIIETWLNADMLGLMQQLGVVPTQ